MVKRLDNNGIISFLEAYTHLEPIYGETGVIAYESLAHASDHTIGELSSAFYKANLGIGFDLVACGIALEQTAQWPVTLNISVISALSPEFWEEMAFYSQKIDPANIIFEILEHDVDPNADIAHLVTMKAQGYRFALDDFSFGQSHEHRLHVFGDLVDFIKIDGPLVRAHFEGERDEFTQNDFAEMLASLQKAHPQAQLIAERVHNRQETETLFSLGINGVQGRDLKPEDFLYTQEE